MNPQKSSFVQITPKITKTPAVFIQLKIKLTTFQHSPLILNQDLSITFIKFWTHGNFPSRCYTRYTGIFLLILTLPCPHPYLLQEQTEHGQMAFHGSSPSLSWNIFFLKTMRTSSMGMQYWYAQHAHLTQMSVLVKERCGERTCYSISPCLNFTLETNVKLICIFSLPSPSLLQI